MVSRSRKLLNQTSPFVLSSHLRYLSVYSWSENHPDSVTKRIGV